MEVIKSFLRRFTQTTPFVLSNTLIIIPYLFFLHLIDTRMSVSVLPFVLFYTFRITGIFLIRGLHRSIDQYTLLMVALLLGGIGSFLTLVGILNFSLYLFGSLFLGLSAAWLPPANTSVNFFEKSKGFQPMGKQSYLFAMIVLIPLFLTTMLSLPFQALAVPTILTLYYVGAYHTVKHYPHYEIDFKELTKHVFSMTELIWFVLFFTALFLLRSGRLLFNESLLNAAIVLFSGIFIVALAVISQAKDRWKIPLWQNILTFVNGMLGNFIFLFGAFYIAVYKGSSFQGLDLFLPYLLGTLLALAAAEKVRKAAGNALYAQLFGLAAGLMLLTVRSLFPIAIFILTFFQKGTSTWLNRLYYQTEAIDEQQRITAKYSTTNKGSVTHQFVLMFLLLITLKIKKLPIEDVFLLKSLHNIETLAVMDIVKFASIILLLAGLWFVGKVGKNAFNH